MDKIKTILTRIDNKLISEAIADDLYQQYVKYVGKLDALPQHELIPAELKDQYGRLMPISSWSTKTTRRIAAEKWAEYNRKLQRDIITGKMSIDPCEYPEEFIQQSYDDCMKAGQKIAKWDRDTSHRKCNKHMELLAKAIDDACKKVDLLKGLPEE